MRQIPALRNSRTAGTQKASTQNALWAARNRSGDDTLGVLLGRAPEPVSPDVRDSDAMEGPSSALRTERAPSSLNTRAGVLLDERVRYTSATGGMRKGQDGVLDPGAHVPASQVHAVSHTS